MNIFTSETYGYDTPRPPQNSLKEDPIHCLSTAFAVSNNLQGTTTNSHGDSQSIGGVIPYLAYENLKPNDNPYTQMTVSYIAHQ